MCTYSTLIKHHAHDSSVPKDINDTCDATLMTPSGLTCVVNLGYRSKLSCVLRENLLAPVA